VGAERGGAARVGDQHALDVVGRVRGLDGARVGVEHLLGVAVVGGDEDRAAARACRFDHAADALVRHGHRLDGGVEDAGVPDHVAVGVVQDDQVVGVEPALGRKRAARLDLDLAARAHGGAGAHRGDAVADRDHGEVGHLVRAHLRLLVLGDGDARHEDAVSPG
jgi:hypothetical protein